MSLLNEFESLDDEVKELLQNYKHKKATIYEPCTLINYRECLIGLGEELGLLNINFVFNPHIDLEDNVLRPDALVKLINAVWTLFHYYKNVSEKSESLLEQNHILEQNNNQLNGMLGKVKNKLCSEKNESKACVAAAQRIADNSDVMLHKLTETNVKLTKVTKQKETCERTLKNEITRLKLENEKLLDRIPHPVVKGVTVIYVPARTMGTSKRLKITVVGDGMVGKTCLLYVYTRGEFPEEYVPTTDCFLVCYSVGSRSSFENVIHKWYPELKHFSQAVPMVLVATKIDLRSANSQTEITTQEGKKLRKKIRAVQLVECSALERLNMDEVFQEAVRAALKKKHVNKRTCNYL
ncbi:Afadin-and alpha-actinin-binding protein [Operophtera brumata]|uniref:Afadin-and alpha-actinin-binding protein n=1 Tax=Operophtera brumata TaxID=104452 RepID=A0A0L7LGE3_OPEBR|nr:Afadin-and alpha-actinin-binding protein [Operophtera brumata]